MAQKVGINLEDLKGLANMARRNGTTDAFVTLVFDWVEQADAEVVRLRAVLEQIASTTGSDDPCRKFVDIARNALRSD